MYWLNRACPLGNQDNSFIATGVLGRSHIWLIWKSKSVSSYHKSDKHIRYKIKVLTQETYIVLKSKEIRIIIKMFGLYAPYPTSHNCNRVMATPALVLLKCKNLKSTQVTTSAIIIINIKQKYEIKTCTLLKSQQITMSILYQSPSPWVFFTMSTLVAGCTFTCCKSPTIQKCN